MDNLIKVQPLEQFSSVIQEILSQLYLPNLETSLDIETNVIQSAKEDIKEIINQSNFDIQKVKEALQNKQWDEDKINCLISLIGEKRSELLYSALSCHNSSHGETINNFDWILKLVLGTNELKCLKIPILQLILHTSSNKGLKMNTYDVNKDMVLKIIEALEEISE